MSLQPSDIKSEIDKALQVLSEQQGVSLATKIRPILYANLDRGRVQNYIEDNINRVPEYVTRVTEKYQRLHKFLHEMQIEKVSETWKPVLDQLEKWAYRFLVKKGYPEVATTWQNAMECANEAASKLYRAYFPYDTEFDPWARVIVHNTCMKFIERDAKGVSVIEESYETLENSLKSINDSILLAADDPNNLLRELMDAIEQLAPERREVIFLKYFKGSSTTEIAKKLGKSIRAVHSLQFRAVQDLRKFLIKNRDRLNE